MKKTLTNIIKPGIKHFSNFHKPSGESNYFVCSMPRSGSTWLMELLSTQPGFKCYNEPLYFRNPVVKKHLGLKNWCDVYDSANEKIIHQYFKNIIEGVAGFLNPNPTSSYYRMFSNRVIFKMIHGIEHKLNWFKEQFNGEIIFLIRHPMAVVISSVDFPRVECLVESEFGEKLNSELRNYARAIIKRGDHHEMGVLSWCLENFVPLQDKTKDWALLTYEQMVTNPEAIVSYLQKKLNLKDTVSIEKNLKNPSSSNRLSDEYTRQILEKEKNRETLITKWRRKVSLEEERKLWDIIDRFPIDVYSYNQYLPNEKFLIQPNTVEVLSS